jgi:hypothetical protein
VIIRNEYAMVEVSIEVRATGTVLRVTDLINGPSTTLDAMELEGICWLDPVSRMRLLTPDERDDDAAHRTTIAKARTVPDAR